MLIATCKMCIHILCYLCCLFFHCQPHTYLSVQYPILVGLRIRTNIPHTLAS